MKWGSALRARSRSTSLASSRCTASMSSETWLLLSVALTLAPALIIRSITCSRDGHFSHSTAARSGVLPAGLASSSCALAASR